MNTKVLEYIVAISEEGSITRASERFYLSQPSLSRHLSAIERELNTKLFRRQGGVLVLTNAGKLYVNGARAILSLERQAEQKLDRLRSKKSKLSIAYPSTLQSVMSQVIVPQFLSLYPDCSLMHVAMDSTERLSAALENNNIDIVVIQREGLPSGTAATATLYASDVALAVPEGSAAAQHLTNQGFNLSALGNACFFLHPPGTSQREMEEEIMAEQTFSPKLACVANEYVTLREVVARGLGCAFLPEHIHRDAIQTATLIPVIPKRVIRFEAVCKGTSNWEGNNRFVQGFFDIATQALGNFLSF